MSRILAIEDSAAIRLLLVRRLGLEGHEVTTCPDGYEAVRLLERASPDDRPEVILLDLHMPRGDGPATLPAIRRLAPAVPVILVTAQSEPGREPALGKVEGRVSKPIDFDLLLAKIAALAPAA